MTLALVFGCAGTPTRTSPTTDLSERDGGRVALDGAAAPSVPWALTPFPAVPVPDDNPITDEKVALGRLLFYDPIVSVDHAVACATCHTEVWGMSDGLPISVGNGAGLLSGPGRTGSNKTRRNAPTLWNVAFRQTEFWDGHATSLEDQVHFPFAAAEELDRNVADVVNDLAGIAEYERLFQSAFPEEPVAVTEATFERALASFERTLLSNDGPYDAYVAGDPGALGPSLLRGMNLFATEGCADCHRPPLFSSERFEDRGVPPIPGVDDAGRFEVTGDEADRNRFKVPTLRNAHETAPYFHTGAVAALSDAVLQEANFSIAHDGAPPIDDAGLADLTAFISKGLFDTQRSPTRPEEVPSGLTVPIDGFNIRR